MNEQQSIWPSVDDGRIVQVLSRQIGESLFDLHRSVEDGLDRLAMVMDEHPDDEVVANVAMALEDLQHIDRVMQRLENVRKMLDVWSQHATFPDGKDAGWAGYMAGRFVMPQEHEALRCVMQQDNK